MVERQGDIHLVGRLRTDRAGKAEHHPHQTRLVDVGGLRQACRAGRVDVKRFVGDGHRLAFSAAEIGRRKLRKRGVDARQIGAGPPAASPWTKTRTFGSMRPRAVSNSRASAASTITIRACAIAMQCARPLPARLLLISAVMQPSFRAAAPDANVIGAVRHEERNGVALAQALRAQPTRIAVGAAIPFGISEPLAVGHEREFVAMLRREGLDKVAERAIGMFHDRAAHAHGAPRACEISEVAFQPCDQLHCPSARLLRPFRAHHAAKRLPAKARDEPGHKLSPFSRR